MLASTFFLMVGLITGGVVVAGGAAIAVPLLTRERRARKRALKELAPSRAKNLPPSVDNILEGLRRALEGLLDAQEYKTATALSSTIALTQEIFEKLSRRGDSHQVNLAVVSYGGLLDKLNRALSSDYFFNMLENPSHWTNVEERKSSVKTAVKVVNAELLDAVRSINGLNEADFTLAIETILRRQETKDLLGDIL